ncbi:hypothetical protein LTR47_011214 [Exophiala xenobiotica]|nr:hypothetical protein LTR92_011089 [Exophiala xenobiotica]KAK5215318.1 hypothetical protein LTR72_011628 [Exophiala xenobiotica]KAK5220348.1 hypothetical protein LTR47_011214 [Exophiala xenobiotica]KAK5245319.1 hypothetical protein LTS06_009233 [Exophiala xenobiotica]KAK5260352.1 hypothetical protein LTR40_004322 [Exophiala xenobiotica]
MESSVEAVKTNEPFPPHEVGEWDVRLGPGVYTHQIMGTTGGRSTNAVTRDYVIAPPWGSNLRSATE